MKLQIDVTSRHIRSGTAGECDQCAIALAFRDKLPRVAVSVTITYPGSRPVAYLDSLVIPLPDSCLQFMRSFDDGMEPLPFSFFVEVPRWLTTKH